MHHILQALLTNSNAELINNVKAKPMKDRTKVVKLHLFQDHFLSLSLYYLSQQRNLKLQK